MGGVELVRWQKSRGEGADLRLEVPATLGRNRLCKLLGRAIEDDRRRRRLHRRAFASTSVEWAYYANIAIVEVAHDILILCCLRRARQTQDARFAPSFAEVVLSA